MMAPQFMLSFTRNRQAPNEMLVWKPPEKGPETPAKYPTGIVGKSDAL